jgi:dihydrofolate synthase/folylpolyglutamate synthase
VIAPLAAGVTRIALEHTEYLGTDLKGIAREKAGIAKAGVPFLTTESDEGLRWAMAEVAQSQGTRLQHVHPDLAAGFELGLKGPHQVANASLAVALADALPEQWRPNAEAVRGGLAAASIPGRFDRRGGWIFDVAHNPDGARALAAALRVEGPPRPLIAVLAVLKDKDWRGMMTALAPAVDEFVLTRSPSAPSDRAWDLDEAVQWARSQSLKVRSVGTLAEALATAHAGAATVVVTGSFHTVGDAMTLLPGFSPVQ